MHIYAYLGLSSANPWLDFLPASTAQRLAGELNEDLESLCSTAPMITPSNTLKRLYGFGLLPLVPSATTSSLLSTVDQMSRLPHLKGIIMGTKGIGKGLDDDALDPVWEALAKTGLVVFLHPHYGVDGSAWGEKENGHVLPLALGFPFETTTVSLSFPRLICLRCLNNTTPGDHTSHPLRRLRSTPEPAHPSRSLRRYTSHPFLPPRLLHCTRPHRRFPSQTRCPLLSLAPLLRCRRLWLRRARFRQRRDWASVFL